MNENEEIECITLESDEEDEGTAKSSSMCIAVIIPVVKIETEDEKSGDLEILAEEDPPPSSSTLSKIKSASKDSILTGNRGEKVGCSTGGRTSAEKEMILKVNKRRSENKPKNRRMDDKVIVYMTPTPTTSSSRSCEIGYTMKDSMQTGNIRKEVGCSTDERTIGTKTIVKARQRKWGSPKDKNKEEIEGEETYECRYCDLKYKSKGRKDKHEREFHTKKQTYSCDTCEKEFQTKGNLKSHQSVHSRDRPFPCSICTHPFKTNSSLKKHKKRHIKKAQLDESIQPLENLKPVANDNIPFPSEGPSTEASGQITSNPSPFPTKSGTLGPHPVGNNDSMILSNVSNEDNEESIQMSISDSPIFPGMEVEEVETVELENGTNSNPGTISASSTSGTNDKELVHDGKMKVKKGMRKSTRKRKPRKPFLPPCFTGGQGSNYKCPHCKKRFASSGKRDYHVKKTHGQTRSIPECRPDEDVNGPSSSNKVLFQAGISNLNPSTTSFSHEQNEPTNTPPANPGSKDVPDEVPQTLSSIEKNKFDKSTFCTIKTPHEDFHREVYLFECSLCDMKFSKKDDCILHLKMHLDIEASKEIIPTRDESEPQSGSISAEGSTEDITTFSSAAGNHNVTQTSNGTGKKLGKNINYILECGECGAGFVCDADLVSHVRNVHPDKRYKCKLCSNDGLSLIESDQCYQRHFKAS